MIKKSDELLVKDYDVPFKFILWINPKKENSFTIQRLFITRSKKKKWNEIIISKFMRCKVHNYDKWVELLAHLSTLDDPS